jgi:hypothetical protein
MGFQKGNQLARNRRSSSQFTDLLRIASSETRDGETRLRRVVEKLFELAEGGNLEAIKLIALRLDGKPFQAVISESYQEQRIVTVAWSKPHPLYQPTDSASSSDPTTALGNGGASSSPTGEREKP